MVRNLLLLGPLFWTNRSESLDRRIANLDLRFRRDTVYVKGRGMKIGF